ncbi:MAG: outer membrane lipoprotein carrier protein LolA [Sphingobacteriales bacterium]|nr:outer membrane lipoprotein carrier protein LolA [Sphingobacteriales bacterium]
MKRITTIALLILATLTLHAQGDKKAKDILNGVSSKYRSYKSMKADFSYTLENPQAKIKETQVGTLLLSGAKYRLGISGQEVICDGKTTWTYMKEVKEVQINDVDPTDEGIKPSEIFTMYEKGFIYKFVDEKSVAGKVQQNLELTPTDKTKNFFKIKLTIDKASKQIVKSVIFEKTGTRYTYAIKAFTPNFAVNASSFTFDAKKYPGVEVVDLR